MNNLPANEDLRVFLAVVRLSGFAAAAEELGTSTAYVSKRIRVLEEVLGVRLLHRTTRRVAVTEDGERVFHWAQQILDDIDQLLQQVSITKRAPRGSLRISSSFGFGRQVVAPMVSRMVARYPELQVRLEVFDRLVDVAAEGFDLDVRIGDEIAPHLIARHLADNHRVLCAAPSYLARRGTPRSLQELTNHVCLVTKERDHPFGVWKLSANGREQSIKVTGPLSSNHGEIVVRWTVDGGGITLRSLWDVGPQLLDGRLCLVLPEWRQKADIWAVYPSRLDSSAKVRVAVNFLQEQFSAPGVWRST